MEIRKKAVINPIKFDAIAFDAFMQEIEELKLAKFENGEIVFEEENQPQIQMIMNKYFPGVIL